MYWQFHIQCFFPLIGLSTADWTVMPLVTVYSVTQCSERALQSMEIWTTALVVLSCIDSLAISAVAAALCSPAKPQSFSASLLSQSACVPLTSLFQHQSFNLQGFRSLKGRMRPWVRSNMSRSIQVRLIPIFFLPISQGYNKDISDVFIMKSTLSLMAR